MNVGNLLGQIMPLIIAWILFPLAMLILYFVVRSELNKRKRARAKLEDTPATPAGGVSALEMLRQATPEAQRVTQYDTGELPELDLLLSPVPTKSAATSPRMPHDAAQRVQLHTGQVTAAKEVLTILRDEHDQRLLVQIGTMGYRTLLDSPEAKKEFTRLMKELSGIIMTPDENASGTLAPLPADHAMPMAEQPEETNSLGDLLAARATEPQAPPIKKTAPPPPPKTTDGRMPGDLPSYKFDDNPANIQMGRGGVKKVEFTPPPTIDIPSAIEAYLQYKIQYTPEYQGRDIHVKSAPGGGVRIQVGDKFFDAVDEVNDVEIRQFLQETIAEWQQRH